jgi:hypothetical protein
MIHTFYNCYASATYEDLHVCDIPPSLVRGVARKTLCVALNYLLNQGKLNQDMVFILEADGEGPSIRHIQNSRKIDRRPLVDYYNSMFGLEPLLPFSMDEPIYRHVPMGTTIGNMISHCQN